MSAKVNDKLVKQPTAKQKAQEAKRAAKAAKDAKRAADVAAKRKAEQEALDAGLKWNDTIVARMFGENYEEAYKAATAGGPDTEENLAIKRKAQTDLAAALDKMRAEATDKPTDDKPVEGAPAETPPAETPIEEVGDKKAKRLSNAELTDAQKRTKELTTAAKAALLGTEDVVESTGAVVSELPPPAKDAEDSASVFAAETPETGEQISERLNRDVPLDEIPVCDDLVKESEAADAKKKAAKEAAKAPPVEESRDEPVVETPKTETKAERKARVKAEKQAAAAAAIAEAGAKLVENETRNGDAPQEDVTTAEVQDAPVETETKDDNVDTQQTPEQSEENNDAGSTPVEEAKPEAAQPEAKPSAEQAEAAGPEQVKPEEATAEQVKPTPTKLTKVVDNTVVDESLHKDDHRTGAAKFYGKAFTPDRKIYLTEAFRLLNMAIKAEAKMLPGSTAVENTFKKAVDMEAQAFGVSTGLAKAA